MPNKISEKEVFYNMLSREIENLLNGVPIFAAFSGIINSYLQRLIDPYVNAFIDPTDHLDSDQLSAFASEEAQNKINAFKAKYDKQIKENQTHE